MLRPRLGGREIAIDIVTTRGDARHDVPLVQLGEGVFVKALEAELLEHRADLAVHSLKDVPSAETEALAIGAVPMREDPRDALITRNGTPFDSLPEGAMLATGSPRRIAQLRALRPDLRFVGVRGNVDTRLRKLDDGEFDGLVMAVAGLARLGLRDRIATVFSVDECTPAVGQGALGVQCRSRDDAVMEILRSIDDPRAHAETAAERAFLRAIGGGCRVPVGALAIQDGDTIRLRAVVADSNGTEVSYSNQIGTKDNAESLGLQAARDLETAMRRYQHAEEQPS